ncbi:MAG: hypothetical protein LKF31_04350 [Muribaculaceae bacterium]|jgi:hypothetical protein|nr:hypothetical protein [Muribaculaceae bacterium]
MEESENIMSDEAKESEEVQSEKSAIDFAKADGIKVPEKKRNKDKKPADAAPKSRSKHIGTIIWSVCCLLLLIGGFLFGRSAGEKAAAEKADNAMFTALYMNIKEEINTDSQLGKEFSDGINALNQGDAKTAIQLLELVHSSKDITDTGLREVIGWNLSLAYLKDHQRDKAIAMLNDMLKEDATQKQFENLRNALQAQ